jgi:H+/Cl- antiporter ClcA
MREDRHKAKKEETNTRLYGLLNSLDNLKWSIAVKGILAGIAAGLGSVLYRMEIEYGSQAASAVYAYLKSYPLMILLWLPAIALAGLLIAWLVKKEPMAMGSGIPQVEGVLLFRLKVRWYIVLGVRYICGILGAVAGLSLGREGPSIQIGASAAQGVSRLTAKNRLERDLLITGGAAAGLSAAFNAPLSGMVFALEEVHRSFSPHILMAATAASLMGDMISKMVFGLKPVLYFSQIPQLPIGQYIWLLPAAVVFGLTGALMNKTLLWLQSAYNRLPWYLRPGLALLIALPFGLFLPQVLGGGQNLIKLAENTNNVLGFIFLVFICKMLFTGLSFGSGTPGGIFMPILAVGALSGSLFGMLASRLGMPAQYIPVFAVCGMAGALSSTVKAPVTGILLTAEMSGSLMHMLPVAACAFIALLVSDLLKIKPIYEALLERFVAGTKPVTEEERGGLLELPVETGSAIASRRIKNIDLPEGCLIVGIRRGTREIVPNGDTKILPGDYLTILAGQENANYVQDGMRKLCHLE